MLALITTPGAGASNSFCSVDEADAFLTDGPDDTTEWFALTPGAKMLRLITAAGLMARMYSYKGFKAYIEQALCFPRSECQELYGYPVDTIPDRVKFAQAFLAYSVAHRHFKSRSAIGEDSARPDIRSFSIGGLSIGFGEGSFGEGMGVEAFINNTHGFAEMLLEPFISGTRGRHFVRPGTAVWRVNRYGGGRLWLLDGAGWWALYSSVAGSQEK